MDGFVQVSGGVDSGQSPSVATAINPEGLPRNKLHFLINGTVRGGKIRPRPGFSKLPFGSWASSGGKFQGADFYKPENDAGCLIASVDGRLYRFNVGTDYSIEEITIAGDANPSVLPRAWMVQAENFFIIQDNQSKPIIYAGSTARRSEVAKEIPVGSVMAYGMGRIWVVLPNGTSFVAGDLVYSKTGTTKDIIDFQENDLIAKGGAFSSPGGVITAMLFPTILDSSLGQGPLQCFTAENIFSVNAPIDRAVWKILSYPIQTISMVAYGALSQWSTQAVNGDTFYRSIDGVRSFILARREFGQYGNTPLSREMKRVIDYDDEALLSYSSAVLFDNRLLMTSSPYRTANGIAHRGLMAIDFDLVSGNGQKLPSAWEGVWSGLKILKVVKGKFGGMERAFAFVSNDGQIEIWEITKTEKADFNGTSSVPIKWVIEPASYSFNNPFDMKKLVGGDIGLEGVSGQVDLVLKYRPDQHPCYQPWFKWNECAANAVCSIEECGIPVFPAPQFRPKMKFPNPPEEFDKLLGRPFSHLQECQPRLEITGYCEIKQLRLHAQELQESQYGGCNA